MKRFKVPFSISGDAFIKAHDMADAIKRSQQISIDEYARMWGDLIVFEEEIKEAPEDEPIKQPVSQAAEF